MTGQSNHAAASYRYEVLLRERYGDGCTTQVVTAPSWASAVRKALRKATAEQGDVWTSRDAVNLGSEPA